MIDVERYMAALKMVISKGSLDDPNTDFAKMVLDFLEKHRENGLRTLVIFCKGFDFGQKK